MADHTDRSPSPSVFKLCLSPEGRTPLRERFRTGKITDYTLDQFMPHNGKSPTDRFRNLDYLRMHTPHEGEVTALNVTPYRMDLHCSQEVMYLCGGLVGVRFSSEDLSSILCTTKRMAAVWGELDEMFRNMPPMCKKTSLKSDVQTGEDSDTARSFHALADEYVSLFGQLQSVIREKQKLINPDERTDAPKLDADPESRMGRKLPEWLSILIEKHRRSKATETRIAETAGQGLGIAKNGEPMRSSAIRVGELSVYLSSCVAGLVQSSEAESDAIATLVQASNDTVMSISNADIHAVTDTAGHGAHRGRCGSPTLFAEGAAPKSRRYWAHRFYNFLSKMTELASAIKDESTVDNM